MSAPRVAVIGAGPAGLAAAEVLATGGAHGTLFDVISAVRDIRAPNQDITLK